MSKTLLSLAAASAILSAVALAPTSASAIGAGSAAGVRAALEDTSMTEDVAYVCRHRGWSSRRACFWTPGRVYRPYRGYGHRRGWRRW